MDQGLDGFDGAGAANALAYSAPPGIADAPPSQRLTPRQVIALQGIVGNRRVASVIRSVAQRSPVTTPNVHETIYNKEDKTTGQALATGAGGAGSYNYDMTRDGDAGVTVTVKIRFLSQARNTTPPPTPNSAGLPELGDPSGPLTEIPVTDPDDRRGWATGIAAGAVKVWNDRLDLIEDAAPAPAAGGPAADAGAPAAGVPAGGAAPATPSAASPKKLKVTFASVPVWGLADKADTQIIIHPKSTIAGTPGQPIDESNWYVNKGGYTGDDKLIAAHEYGHLLGINDEYSQNSSQLNALIHQAAPPGAPSAGPAMDQVSVQRMVLNSLKQPLYVQLGAE